MYGVDSVDLGRIINVRGYHRADHDYYHFLHQHQHLQGYYTTILNYFGEIDLQQQFLPNLLKHCLIR